MGGWGFRWSFGTCTSYIKQPFVSTRRTVVLKRRQRNNVDRVGKGTVERETRRRGRPIDFCSCFCCQRSCSASEFWRSKASRILEWRQRETGAVRAGAVSLQHFDDDDFSQFVVRTKSYVDIMESSFGKIRAYHDLLVPGSFTTGAPVCHGDQRILIYKIKGAASITNWTSPTSCIVCLIKNISVV